MTFQVGQQLTATRLNTEALAGRMIAQIGRTSSSTSASAAQGVLRLDDVPMTSGRVYWIATSALTMIGTVTTDTGTARLSFTTDGSTPTTGSTLLNLANSGPITSTGNGINMHPGAFYNPGSDIDFSVLLWTQRLSGTGTVQLSAAANRPIQLFIVDIGVDPGTGYGTSI